MLRVKFGVTIHALKVLSSPFMKALDMQLIDGLGFESFLAKFALDLDALLVLFVSAEMESVGQGPLELLATFLALKLGIHVATVSA
jgi:hypothetical protein